MSRTDNFDRRGEVDISITDMDKMQKHMYRGVNNAERELETANNKYALRLLEDHLSKLEPNLTNRSVPDKGREFYEDYIRPIRGKIERLLVRKERPGKDVVQKVVDCTKAAIHVYDDEYYGLKSFRYSSLD